MPEEVEAAPLADANFRSKSPPDTPRIPLLNSSRDASVEKFSGFTEHAYRLLFDYEDHFTTEPTVKTILPSGATENSKVCKPAKGKALIGYVFPQTISEVAAQQYKADPCVWQRSDGTFAVVQVWSTNYNDDFKRSFVVTSSNPDSSKFIPQAVQEFQRAMIGIFGDAAKEQSILFCSRATENKNPVYVGDSEELFDLLLSDQTLSHDLKLEKILSDGFLAKVENKKGESSVKPFVFSPCIKYALYTKEGFDTMACITPFDLFMKDRLLHARIDAEKIAELKVVETLPEWLCDEDVCKLDKKFKQDCLAQGKWRKPLPLHAVAGPALKWAWIACGLTWLGTLCIFLSEYYLGHCHEDVWTSHWCTWVVLGAFVIARLFCEYRALRYFFLPYAQESRRLARMPCNGGLKSQYHFKLPIIGSVSAQQWLIGTFFISVNSIVDPGLRAITQAMIMRNPECGDSNLQQEAWVELMSFSIIGRFLDPDIWDKLRLQTFALVIFTLMFAQSIYPLVTCLVCRDSEERVKNGPITFELTESPDREVRWTTPLKRCWSNAWKSTYHESLQIVGFSAGMASVNAMFPAQPIAEVNMLLNDRKDGFELRSVRRAQIILSLVINMMFLQMLLQNTLSLQIQSLAFFCHYLCTQKVQYKYLCSILSSTITVTGDVVALGVPTLVITHDVYRRIEERLPEVSIEMKQNDNKPYNELLIEELNMLRSRGCFVAAVKILCLGTIALTVVSNILHSVHSFNHHPEHTHST